MLIVLSQKIDTESSYQDRVFSVYHYPKQYKNQIHEGDVFVYYQGNRSIRNQRYYFGTGKIASITCEDGENYYAELVFVTRFDNNVPIYLPNGGYVEEMDYETVRRNKIPSWQQSIRPISEAAFNYILGQGIGESEAVSVAERLSQVPISEQDCARDIDSETTIEYVIEREGARREIYTTRYERKARLRKQAIIIHGTTCMACGFNFYDVYGERGKDYIEVHHIKPLANSDEEIDVNPSTDLVVVCSNCHRIIHRKRNEILTIEELKRVIFDHE